MTTEVKDKAKAVSRDRIVEIVLLQSYQGLPLWKYVSANEDGSVFMDLWSRADVALWENELVARGGAPAHQYPIGKDMQGRYVTGEDDRTVHLRWRVEPEPEPAPALPQSTLDELAALSSTPDPDADDETVSAIPYQAGDLLPAAPAVPPLTAQELAEVFPSAPVVETADVLPFGTCGWLGGVECAQPAVDDKDGLCVGHLAGIREGHGLGRAAVA